MIFKKPSWSVLRDDFLMGNKMKDWDDGDEDEEDKEMESKPKNIDNNKNNGGSLNKKHKKR
jgi:hypothetical protein